MDINWDYMAEFYRKSYWQSMLLSFLCKSIASGHTHTNHISAHISVVVGVTNSALPRQDASIKRSC